MKAEIPVESEEFQRLQQEITLRVDAFASEKGYAFSRARDRILRELVRCHLQFGEFYCPCQEDNNSATICVCQEVREEGYVDIMGKCHCSLFVKPKD